MTQTLMNARELLAGAVAADGRSKHRIAVEAEVDAAFLGKVLAGEKSVSVNFARKVGAVLGLDVEQLVAMVLEEKHGEGTPRLPFDAAAFDRLRELTMDGFAIPYYGRVGCGEFLELCEVAQGTRNVPARYVDDPADPAIGTVEAWGDSMTKAKIHEGMTLLVRCQNTAKPGQIVLADVPFAGTTCKRLAQEGRKRYLVAESSGSYPRIEVTAEVRIVGVVSAAWLAVEF